MKKNRKGSISYKCRAWTIVLLGISEILNYITVLTSDNNRFGNKIWIAVILVLIFTLLEILTEFSIGSKDGLIMQSGMFITSIMSVGVTYRKKIMCSILVGELLLLIFGLIYICWRNYKPR